ncbi:uncharacterized protein AKAW2_50303A [Aspergillus luchuensis]|uniref:Uncharacterized protein n=1 Tax=Aspergillus kawachii TaxID=1069201 RepID=A0A7R7WBL3_ASPKA|nr:uncharacterized protein AKAW2_50303A [Aspergillus luchuensis]BCR99961.1 hypothetical protein AKAW2_50303A [Aspergillus luchuensis]
MAHPTCSQPLFFRPPGHIAPLSSGEGICNHPAMEPRSETHYDSDVELDVYARFIIPDSGFLSSIGLLNRSMIHLDLELVTMDATIRPAIEDAILSPSTRFVSHRSPPTLR